MNRRVRWAKQEAERQRRRDHERSLFAVEMQRQHGAPEGCELGPADCARLATSIYAAGNDPPAWILSAARSWCAATGFKPACLWPDPR